eukprot:6180333-Pleurochrysis_carterae.AAC.1
MVITYLGLEVKTLNNRPRSRFRLDIAISNCVRDFDARIVCKPQGDSCKYLGTMRIRTSPFNPPSGSRTGVYNGMR